MNRVHSVAEVLYQSAKSRQQLDVVHKELNDFYKGFGGQSAFLQLFLTDAIDVESKRRFFEDIIRLFSEETKIFFKTFMSENDYVGLSRSISYFEALYVKSHAIITSATPLSREQIDAICKGVSRKCQQNIDTYELILDEAVIGGVKVQVSDWIMDTTLQTQLDKFTASL